MTDAERMRLLDRLNRAAARRPWKLRLLRWAPHIVFFGACGVGYAIDRGTTCVIVSAGFSMGYLVGVLRALEEGP